MAGLFGRQHINVVQVQRIVADGWVARRTAVQNSLVLILYDDIKKFYDKLNNVLGSGGEGGIRTRGTLLKYTRFPSVHLKPLGHLSW